MTVERAEQLNPRNERRHNAGEDDQRTRFERDRDRIHYSSAFRRLGGVSQVVSTDHIEPFHNRLTHTIKVAQLGRRLAQHICIQQPEEARDRIDPEVVEAACLAHDLGHPPFGHVGEDVLDQLVKDNGDEEGFEGNAQTFRILTKLALRSTSCFGLDLTRAVLAATIKYPWSFEKAKQRGTKKFGYFKTEKEDFEFAREGLPPGTRSIEAQIMDYADDIAYSVHDLEDFHRIRAVPWQLFRFSREIDASSQMGDVLQAALKKWYDKPPNAEALLAEAATRIMRITLEFPQIYQEPYEGTKEQRISLRNWTSDLIRRYVLELSPRIIVDSSGARLELKPEAEAEIHLLKQITRSFVIDGPTIGAQQRGQRRIIEETYQDLIGDIKDALKSKRPPKLVPKRFHYLIEENPNEATPARLAADCIAGLTEHELTALFKRLRGFASGSIVDPIVR